MRKLETVEMEQYLLEEKNMLQQVDLMEEMEEKVETSILKLTKTQILF